jgi:hypothetical protein
MSTFNINPSEQDHNSTLNNLQGYNNSLNCSYNLNRISSKENKSSTVLSSIHNSNNTTANNPTNTNTHNNSTNNNISNYHAAQISSIKANFQNNKQKEKEDLNRSECISATSNAVNKKNDEKLKEFFIRQNKIFEEMTGLKDDLQFILENKKKTKMMEKIQQSIRDRDRDQSLNESSILDQSFTSNISTQTVKKKLNLKEKFENKNLIKFQEFLSSYKHNKQLLLLVDNKNCVWELVKRNDLNIYSLARENENLISITSALYQTNLLNIEDSPKSKLLNIEIKDNYDNRSLNNSELDISKVSEFNISHYIRETCNDISLIN